MTEFHVATALFERIGKYGDRTAIRYRQNDVWQEISWNGLGEQIRAHEGLLQKAGGDGRGVHRGRLVPDGGRGRHRGRRDDADDEAQTKGHQSEVPESHRENVRLMVICSRGKRDSLIKRPEFVCL